MKCYKSVGLMTFLVILGSYVRFADDFGPSVESASFCLLFAWAVTFLFVVTYEEPTPPQKLRCERTLSKFCI